MGRTGQLVDREAIIGCLMSQMVRLVKMDIFVFLEEVDHLKIDPKTFHRRRATLRVLIWWMLSLVPRLGVSDATFEETCLQV